MCCWHLPGFMTWIFAQFMRLCFCIWSLDQSDDMALHCVRGQGGATWDAIWCFCYIDESAIFITCTKGGCWFAIDEVVKSLEKWLFSLVSIWGTLLLSVQLSWGFQVIQCLQLCSTTKDGWAYFTRTMNLNLIHHLIHKILVQTCCFKVCNC